MKASTGFTLVELAIAVMIIALLLAGALVPLSTQMEVRSIADTQRAMELIRDAMIGYAQRNGRLPCPADGTIATGVANAGIEQPTAGPCASAVGTVPWVTLGVPETDGWSRRFSYWVAPNFGGNAGANFGCASAPVPTPTITFALCTPGNLIVNTRNDSTHAAQPIGQGLAAVIISHGKNGAGAFRPLGGTPPAPTSGADEIANANHAGAGPFISRSPTPSASPSPCNDNGGAAFCEFDDIVVMLPTSLLTARMVAAGRLP